MKWKEERFRFTPNNEEVINKNAEYGIIVFLCLKRKYGHLVARI